MKAGPRYLKLLLVVAAFFALPACENNDGAPEASAPSLAQSAAQPSAAQPPSAAARALPLLVPNPMTIDPGDAYLAEHATREGVLVTASGLQYVVLATGEGRRTGPGDTVVTHYVGSFIDGQVFDNTRRRNLPATFPLDKVIKGWSEALQLMREGDKWRLVIPPELGYGRKGLRPIPPDAVLIFEVELLEVKKPK